MENLILNIFNINLADTAKFNTVSETNGDVTAYIRLKRKELYCPKCGRKLVGNGVKKKTIIHKFMTDRMATINYEANRYRCLDCGYSELEKNPFAFPGFSTSILVINQIMVDLHNPQYNYTMIAKRNGVSVNEVILYFDSYVTIPHIPLPVNLGIDEFHSKMAKRRDASYLGVLINNDKFSLVDILTSRNKTDLNNFFESYKEEERLAVKYVTIDMWEPYKVLAHEWLKNAKVAVDPFHVVKHLNDGFTKLRIKLMNKCVYGSNAYYLLKTWHKLLESDKYDLDNEPRYNPVFRCKLNYGDIKKMLLEIDETFTKAYELKESYRWFNLNCTYESADKELTNLIYEFSKANICEYGEFLGIMIHWKEEIINSFIISEETGHRLSNAKTEKMNREIEININISNGLSNFKRFRKRMIYCFNDNVFYGLTSKLTSLKRDFKNKNRK